MCVCVGVHEREVIEPRSLRERNSCNTPTASTSFMYWMKPYSSVGVFTNEAREERRGPKVGLRR